ncbi:MAG: hypothetical protein WBA93_24620 [Microcoleaceae cyanobacterium]
MLPKSEQIEKQQQLVNILEAQLKQAKTRLSKLAKVDSKVESLVAQLETILAEHQDYRQVVSDRLNLNTKPEPILVPVRIEIESLEETLEQIPQTSPPSDILKPQEEEQKNVTLTTETTKLPKSTEEIEQLKADLFPPYPNTLQAHAADKPKESTVERLLTQMLCCKTKKELEQFKAEIGEEKAKTIWKTLTKKQKTQIIEICKSKPKQAEPTLKERVSALQTANSSQSNQSSKDEVKDYIANVSTPL